jgi:dihydrolipoamide dehydrogenase
MAGGHGRDHMREFDLLVLGGGNAVTVAMAAGRRGLRAAVVEKAELGGTCPNHGCIPSKLLLGYAEAASRIREAGRFHLEATLGAVDGPALLAETFGATRQTDGKIAGALGENVTLFRGAGRFVAERTVEVGGERIRGERVVVGTGTRPRAPEVDGVAGTPYWTSHDVFGMDVLPASILIVGGGYIACELAQFFHGVGVETTLVHRNEVLLRGEDEEVRAVFTGGFTERVPCRLSTEVLRVSHDGAGFALAVRSAAGEETLRAEKLLFAIGRVPNGDTIAAAEGGIEVDDGGWIRVDDRLRTTAEGVWALGDVVGGHQFTHTAAWEAKYLERVLLDGEDAPLDHGPVPHAVFSMPEVAGVGATEQELRASGVAYLAASLPYTTAAKGRAIKEHHGLCKVIVALDGALLGCHVVGEDASVMVHMAIMAMRWKPRIEALTEVMYIHPSLPEVLRNTARKAAAMIAG